MQRPGGGAHSPRGLRWSWEHCAPTSSGRLWAEARVPTRPSASLQRHCGSMLARRRTSVKGILSPQCTDTHPTRRWPSGRTRALGERSWPLSLPPPGPSVSRDFRPPEISPNPLAASPPCLRGTSGESLLGGGGQGGKPRKLGEGWKGEAEERGAIRTDPSRFQHAAAPAGVWVGCPQRGARSAFIY